MGCHPLVWVCRDLSSNLDQLPDEQGQDRIWAGQVLKRRDGWLALVRELPVLLAVVEMGVCSMELRRELMGSSVLASSVLVRVSSRLAALRVSWRRLLAHPLLLVAGRQSWVYTWP